MIKTVISGRIVKPLELLHTTEGKEYVRIRVSSKKKNRDANGKPVYDYVDIVAFGEAAKCHFNNLNKGSAITAVCRFETNQYTDKNGEKHYGYSFYAEDIDYMYIPKEDGINENKDTLPLPKSPNVDDIPA